MILVYLEAAIHKIINLVWTFLILSFTFPNLIKFRAFDLDK